MDRETSKRVAAHVANEMRGELEFVLHKLVFILGPELTAKHLRAAADALDPPKSKVLVEDPGEPDFVPDETPPIDPWSHIEADREADQYEKWLDGQAP